MKLVYIYIQKFRNIERQEINLSANYHAHYEGGVLSIRRKDTSVLINYVYGNSFMRNLHVIVGKTGSGKTNLLQMLGMDMWQRMEADKNDAYMMLYEMMGNGRFMAEVIGMEIEGITSPSLKKKAFWGDAKSFLFEYDFQTGKAANVKVAGDDDMENTYVVNAFDRYAFAHCPYPDEHNEGISERDGLLPRIVSQYGKSSITLECAYLQDYLNHFDEHNIKRRASLVIRKDNWSDKIQFDLDERLMRREYWTFESRAEEQLRKAREHGNLDAKKEYPHKSTPKTRFLHDLMTDFAIYLRKWVECLGDDDAAYLPDGRQMSILKRIDLLCQYLDFHTDEYTGNHGLIWQICDDIKDIFALLSKMDDKYFTDEEFSIPVIEIDQNEKSTMQELFERMDQYRADEVGVFTEQLLPYHWTYVSSGEYQYAKIWGMLDEYAVRLKIGSSRSRGDYHQPNLIVLFDEPESYMHPEMCRTFINKMQEILHKRNPDVDFQILLSTHSPFMLSDVLAEQVIKMDFDERGMCQIMLSDKPYFAANIHSIMADGFFLKYTIGEQARLFLTEKFGLLSRMLERDAPIGQADAEEVAKMQMLLPSIGDDMIRGMFANLIQLILSR